MNDKLLIALMFLIVSPFIATLAEAGEYECVNESPWGELIGAFGGAWAGNQLGGSGLWTIAGAVGGAMVGQQIEESFTCQQQMQEIRMVEEKYYGKKLDTK